MQRAPGRLVLKGVGPLGAAGGAAGAARKRARDDDGAGAGAGAGAGGAAAAAPAPAPAPAPGGAAAPAPAAPARAPGSGALRASATTVTGVGTRFDAEVRAGDVLEAFGEARRVAFVVSATSLALAAPFAADARAPAPFFVVRARDARADAAAADPARAAREAEAARLAEAARFTGAAAGRVEVKGAAKGSYATVDAPPAGSREAALDARAKARGRDKFA